MTPLPRGLPARVGVGLRGPHVPRILGDCPPVPWFELLTDNHLAPGGAARFQAEAVAERYPVALHGVGLSVAGTEALCFDYLERVVDLARRLGAVHVSEHLAFTRAAGRHVHDLLPVPFTTEVLRHVAARVRAVQDRLGQRLLLENVSSYVTYRDSTCSEAAFLAELCAETGCALLLDVNNLYVNAVNRGADPSSMLADVAWDAVAEIHVAGHTRVGSLLVDTHGAAVSEPVLDLLAQVVRRLPEVPVLLEWDTHLPDWDGLWREASRVERVRRAAVESRV